MGAPDPGASGAVPHNESDIRGKRILVVGINYAPEPTGSAPYTSGICEMLAQAGAQIEVITGVPHYPAWRVDRKYRYRLRTEEVVNGVVVRRARHFVPRRQSALTRIAWEGTFLANAGFVRAHSRPDVVIASSPSLSGAVVAARAARHFHAPLGIIIQDLVGQAAAQSGVSGGGRVAGTAGRVEAWALAQADLIAVVSESFRSHLHDYGIEDDKIRTLPNWVHTKESTRERTDIRQSLGWDASTFVAMHTGNMGLKQDLNNLIEAARLLPPNSRILIALMGDGSQREELMRNAENVPAVHFLPPVADDLYADMLNAADLLLVNERPSVGDMSLPSKLTSYFASGQPVLAAVSEDGACARELTAASGSAKRVVPGKPAVLAREIQYLSSEPKMLIEMGQRGQDYARSVLGIQAARTRAIKFASELVCGVSDPNDP